MELNSYLVLNVGRCGQCNEFAVPIKCVEYRDQPSDFRLILHLPLPQCKCILTRRQQYPNV
jgi:hypothetical protein